jgi:hypothetical protein
MTPLLLMANLQVRNQRNKFVALIAAAKQASVEMADRIKLLTSEQEILTLEVANKAKLLAKVGAAAPPVEASCQAVLSTATEA